MGAGSHSGARFAHAVHAGLAEGRTLDDPSDRDDLGQQRIGADAMNKFLQLIGWRESPGSINVMSKPLGVLALVIVGGLVALLIIKIT
jgi:hypothetical protein